MQERAYLMSKPLLLKVEAGRPELGALVEDGRPRPGCESALHCGGMERIMERY